jgi:predicted Zn-ribbon and HTH transcriptional regulator
MTHREIHVQLHDSLDKLLADYFSNVKNATTQNKIIDLMEWSGKQATEPDHPAVINCAHCRNHGFIVIKREHGMCIERCNHCERFKSDDDAAKYAWELINKSE